MANTFLTPEQIAAAAMGLLRRDIVLPATVSRTAEANFRAGSGATVNVRRPGTATARVYTDEMRNAGTPITVDEITETMLPIVLDTHIYSAVACTDEQLTLDIASFGAQVLEPQTSVVSESAENRLAQVLNGMPVEGTIDAANVHPAIIDARRRLNLANVPQGDRYLVVSADVEAAILTDADRRLVAYDGGGNASQQALREAIIGRLYGFTVLVSNALTPGTAVAYHRDAFTFALRAPVVPDGATFGQSVADRGVAMRWLRDYDAAFLRDRSIVSVFAGARVLDDNRAVKLALAGA